jgi:hypothetical protein
MSARNAHASIVAKDRHAVSRSVIHETSILPHIGNFVTAAVRIRTLGVNTWMMLCNLLVKDILSGYCCRFVCHKTKIYCRFYACTFTAVALEWDIMFT